MAVSIAELGSLQPVDTLDGDTYKTQSSKSKFELPPAGKYSFRSPDTFAGRFGKTGGGNLKVDLAPTVVAPAFEGFEIRYNEVSAKTFERDGGTASLMGDYLKAAGYTGNIPGDPQELANAIESTAGTTYEGILDWRASKGRDFEVRGMKNFPQLPDGTYQSWVDHPTLTTTNDRGEEVPVRVWARARIFKYIAKTN